MSYRNAPHTDIINDLGDELVRRGILTADQLAVAKESQKTLGGRLDKILIDKKFVPSESLLQFLGEKTKLPVISLKGYAIDPNVLKLFPSGKLRKWRAVPLFKVEDAITMAVADPFDEDMLEEIHQLSRSTVQLMLALEPDILASIDEAFGHSILEEESLHVDVLESGDQMTAGEESAPDQLEREASAATIITTVNQILSQAVVLRASDIHFEPLRDGALVRFRIDGVLEEVQTLPRMMHEPIVSRMKILGAMDVAERRQPQDGRVRLRIGGKEVDLRLATYPTMFGEAVTARLLSRDHLLTLNDLGMIREDQRTFEALIAKPHGMILVTGPTGSGKTTTLYSALLHLNRQDKHVISIEDPIEHEIPLVNQAQVNAKAGVTFASALRSILRQDPDVIMIGEIRDQDTAEIAVRAAMTGHLVFSTLHTNSAAAAFTRLGDFGIESYKLASSVIGVIGQRLVRCVCTVCAVREDIPSDVTVQLGIEPFPVMKGKGCRECRMSGYKGRIGLFEVVLVDDLIRQFVNKGENAESDIRHDLVEKGRRFILDDGLNKARSGITNVDEVLRVIRE